MHLVSCTNTHHDIKDLVNHEMVKNEKTLIYWERNITFIQNKKVYNPCLRWHILASCHFVTEITPKGLKESIGFPDAELYAELFGKTFIKIKYSRCSLDPENSCCGHQQSYNFFSVFCRFRDTCRRLRKTKIGRWSRRINYNWGKNLFISKGNSFRADQKKTVYSVNYWWAGDSRYSIALFWWSRRFIYFFFI